MKYSVLILTSGAYPNLNANSKIAYEIGSGLKKYFGCNVTLLSVCNSHSDYEEPNPYNLELVRFSSMINYYEVMGIRGQKLKKLFKFITAHRVASIFCRYKKNGLNKVLEDEYYYFTKQELKKKKYDCVIGFHDPEIIANVLYRIRKKTHTVFYMLDPWSTRYLEDKEIEKAKEKELAYVDKFDRIFSSKLIYDDYINVLKADDTILGKFVVAGYPNICRFPVLERPRNLFDEKYTHFVFSGKLYKDIRSSKYAVSFFEKLKDDGVIFHIFGFLDTEDELPKNVVFHGNIPQNELDLYINDADFLVNIGNNVSNRMPSKILSYISTGKPILNFIKINNCPTREYIEKYELGFNVFEKDTITDEDIANVRHFIKRAKGQRIPFEVIENTYLECTPKYVCGQIIEAINDIV